VLEKRVRGVAIFVFWSLVVFAAAMYVFAHLETGWARWLSISVLVIVGLLLVFALVRLPRRRIVLTRVGFTSGRLALRWDQVEQLTFFRTRAPYGGFLHWIGVWPKAGVDLPRFARVSRLQRRLFTEGAPVAIAIDSFTVGVQGVLEAFERFHEVEGP
jgi:hypothetical protein